MKKASGIIALLAVGAFALTWLLGPRRNLPANWNDLTGAQQRAYLNQLDAANRWHAQNPVNPYA